MAEKHLIQRELFGQPHGSEVAARRGYPVNERFFTDVASDAQAYVLGFVSADGTLITTRADKKPNVLLIRLAAKDEGHVAALARVMDCGAPIRRYVSTCATGKYPYSHLAINSLTLARSLVDLGVTPNKTYTLAPWEGPAALRAAYWRGFIDGDGCWQSEPTSGGTGRRWRCALSGTKAVCDGFARFVESLGGRTQAVFRRGDYWVVAVAHLPSIRLIAEAFYRDAVIWLDRKRQIVQAALDYTVSTVRTNDANG